MTASFRLRWNSIRGKTKNRAASRPVEIQVEERELLAALVEAAHAAGANLEAILGAIDRQALLLHVRRERAIGVSLREADIVPERFGLSANFALPGHESTPLLMQ
jgi:hypothetical protein